MNKWAISPLIRYFRAGLVPWIMVALVFLFWTIISGPLEFITNNFFLKIILLFPIVVATGFLKDLFNKIKKLIIKRTFIQEMFPDALKGRKVVRWPIAQDVYAVGVLLREDEERGVSIVMDVMGGPTSLTWNQREVKSSLVSEIDGRTAMDLFAQLISLGANKE